MPRFDWKDKDVMVDSTRSNWYIEIQDSRPRIHTCLKDTNQVLRVLKGSLERSSSTAFMNGIAMQGLITLVMTTFKVSFDQLDFNPHRLIDKRFLGVREKAYETAYPLLNVVSHLGESSGHFIDDSEVI